MSKDGKIKGVVLTPRTLSRIRGIKHKPQENLESNEDSPTSPKKPDLLGKPKPLISSYAQKCKRKAPKSKIPKRTKEATPQSEKKSEGDRFLQTGTLLSFIPSKYAYQEVQDEHAKIRDRAQYLSEQTESLKIRRRNERISAAEQFTHESGFDSKEYNQTLTKIFFDSNV